MPAPIRKPVGKPAGKPVKKSSTAKSAAPEPPPAKPFKAHASRLVSSKIAYKGLVFNVHADTVQEPNGFIHKREVIHHVGSVVILAIDESQDPKDPIVILERQYRHAVGKFLLELPAGRIEPRESPLAAAKREMIEETGYRAKRWTPLAKYYASPGFLGERMQIYLARDIREGTAQPEADEQIEILRIPLSDAMALVHSGKIQDGKTLIGLFSLDSALRSARL